MMLQHRVTLPLPLVSRHRIPVWPLAGWCPPCRHFSPVLAEYARKHADDFVVVFMSGDRSADEMRAYVGGSDGGKGKPFLAVPFEKQDIRNRLSSSCGIYSIPTLVIFDENGIQLTKDGRGCVTSKADTCLADWRNGQPGIEYVTCVGVPSPM